MRLVLGDGIGVPVDARTVVAWFERAASIRLRARLAREGSVPGRFRAPAFLRAAAGTLSDARETLEVPFRQTRMALLSPAPATGAPD